MHDQIRKIQCSKQTQPTASAVKPRSSLTGALLLLLSLKTGNPPQWEGSWTEFYRKSGLRVRKVAPIFASRVAKEFAQSQMHYSGTVKCRVPATCPACPSHPPVDQHLTTCHDQIEQSQHQYPYSLADACRTPRSNVEPVQGKPMLFRKTLNGTGNLRCVSNIDGHGTASGCHVAPLRRCRWREP